MKFRLTSVLLALVIAPSLQAQTSTDKVECDFSQSIYNDSDSVSAISESIWSCEENSRSLVANGLPDHPVGEFPNENNPNTISEQSISKTFPLSPVKTDEATQLGGPRGGQGYVLNGIKIDASTAGSCDDSGNNCSMINPSGNWHIEALGHNSFDFGTDDNNAHVQPGGEYHYHGMPEGFIDMRGGNSSTMTLIAWAADGFPIYARYGYSDPTDSTSPLKPMTGSYKLLDTPGANRPSTDTYSMGTFQEDWEYVAGLGDLDECNGRYGVTPDFPNGIYHYYATDTYPYFQRCVKGVVEVTDARGTGNRAQRGQRPDLAKAAATLEVSEKALKQALGAPPPDFAQAAKKLGVSEQALRQALNP